MTRTLVRPAADPFSAAEVTRRRSTSARGTADQVGPKPPEVISGPTDLVTCGSCGRDVPLDAADLLEDARRQRWHRCHACREATEARYRQAYGEDFYELNPILQRRLDGDR